MIDLRTDTVTRPTEAMLESMRESTLGDDSRDGDETVGRLESLAAAMMGKEAGAYMPSGTMTNLVAVLAHTPRGGEVPLEAGSHILVQSWAASRLWPARFTRASLAGVGRWILKR
jgi:threonine aldolase